MGVSNEQRIQRVAICACGCGQEFAPFPIYANKNIAKNPEDYIRITGKRGGDLFIPKYKRSHNPQTHPKGRTTWNRGLTGNKSQSVSKQGGKGKNHWKYAEDQHPDWFSSDFDFKAFAEKFGNKPRSKGCNKIYARFRNVIMQRDNFTCVDCGMVADQTEEVDLLQVHHNVFVKHDKTRIFDPSNVVTLCYNCHRKRHKNKQAAAP